MAFLSSLYKALRTTVLNRKWLRGAKKLIIDDPVWGNLGIGSGLLLTSFCVFAVFF